MKIAVVYNRESKSVINLFGRPNKERYGKRSIERIVRSLKQGGHQVLALEGDKDLIARLEDFMPRVVAGERPGMVFNLSYGIQGQARYTHVPGILEMVGLPYVGSGPLAHSLALDKVVAKMIFVQHGLPTPEFAVLESADFPDPGLEYPLIVKPRGEAVSFGIRVVQDEDELRAAAQVLFDEFDQPVLVERYIEGREINVGLLGNHPVEALPPAELVFGEGPRIYTEEDKKKTSGREVTVQCPADLPEELIARAQDVARRAFRSLGLADCARVDMRLDEDGNLFILEINSLPSLGEHGSYTAAAEAVGLDFAGLVNRLVEVATARIFGTPTPPAVQAGKADPATRVFDHLTARRDRLEKRVERWCQLPSRAGDAVGLRAAAAEAGTTLDKLGLRPATVGNDPPFSYCWETPKGLAGGTLIVAQLDVPLPPETVGTTFRRDPEWLAGEGIGCSRAPLTMLEHALRALPSERRRRDLRAGVLLHTDEGEDATNSAEALRAAMNRAGEVVVLRPGGADGKVVDARRGQRSYRLVVHGPVRRLGQSGKRTELLPWLWDRLQQAATLSSRKDRIAVGVGAMRTVSWHGRLPHEVRVDLNLGFADGSAAGDLEQKVRSLFGKPRDGLDWRLDAIAHRPPMPARKESRALVERLAAVAQRWEIPFQSESSVVPSVAGLVPPGTPVLCGFGPATHEPDTAREAVQRLSLVQRTLLLAQYLLSRTENR